MNTLSKKYRPINCAFHDYLEHFATLRKVVSISYKNPENGNLETLPKAIIFDLTGGRDGEFTHIKHPIGTSRIRNDYLISVNDIIAASFIDDRCST